MERQPFPALTMAADLFTQAMNDKYHPFWLDAWEFELYLNNSVRPEEAGWEIKLGYVHANSRAEAVLALKTAYGPCYDDLIDKSQSSPYREGTHINDTKGPLRAHMLEALETKNWQNQLANHAMTDDTILDD